jgi:hypothetical protein
MFFKEKGCTLNKNQVQRCLANWMEKQYGLKYRQVGGTRRFIGFSIVDNNIESVD